MSSLHEITATILLDHDHYLLCHRTRLSGATSLLFLQSTCHGADVRSIAGWTQSAASGTRTRAPFSSTHCAEGAISAHVDSRQDEERGCDLGKSNSSTSLVSRLRSKSIVAALPLPSMSFSDTPSTAPALPDEATTRRHPAFPLARTRCRNRWPGVSVFCCVFFFLCLSFVCVVLF